MEVNITPSHIRPRACSLARVRLGWAVPALLAALAVAGCRQEQVTHYRVPKQTERVAAASSPASAPIATAAAGDLPPPAAPAPGSALEWTLPRGWTQSVAGGMRYATLKPPVDGKIDVSVVVLPGAAGGELANVNRWRGQIGLGAIDEATLAASRNTLKTRAGPLAVYDFSSDGAASSRMVAALTVVDGSTWFVKLTGEAAPVTAVRPEFMQLLESLRLGRSN